MTKKKRPSEADLFAAAIQRGLRAWQNNGIDVKSGSINDVADSTTAEGTNGLHHGQQGEQREQKGENGSPHRDLDGPSCSEAESEDALYHRTLAAAGVSHRMFLGAAASSPQLVFPSC